MANKSVTGWSKEFPSHTGDYWFRTDEDEPMIIEVSGGGLPGGAPVPFRVYEFGMDENGVTRDEFQHEHRKAEYLGPITPAETEQLVRLREAITNASLHNPPYNAGREYARGFARAKKLILGDLDAALRHALGTKEQ